MYEEGLGDTMMGYNEASSSMHPQPCVYRPGHIFGSGQSHVHCAQTIQQLNLSMDLQTLLPFSSQPEVWVSCV